MRIPLLLLALFTALSPRWEPAATAGCMSRPERLRQELSGVQMELMDVMQTDPAAAARLRGREEELKYELREEQIRLQDSAECRDRTPSELAMRCVSSPQS
jgi:hypothetical protein